MRKWPAPLSMGVQREDSGSISPNDSFQVAVSHRKLPSCSLGTSNISPRASVSQRNSGCRPGPLCHYLPPKKNAKQWLWLSGHWTNPNQIFPFGRVVEERDPHQQKGLGLTTSRREERGFKKALFLRSWPPTRKYPSISPSIQHPCILCKWASLHPSPCQVWTVWNNAI